jgi:hypothetical protein
LPDGAVEFPSPLGFAAVGVHGEEEDSVPSLHREVFFETLAVLLELGILDISSEGHLELLLVVPLGVGGSTEWSLQLDGGSMRKGQMPSEYVE